MAEDLIDASLVAKEFNLGKDFSWERDVKIQGKSGVTHKIDLVVTSKNEKRTKIAVLIGTSSNLAEDIMKFNAIAEDCGINLKAVIVDKELDRTEYNLAKMFNIVPINPRSASEPEEIPKINIMNYSSAINEIFKVDVNKYAVKYNTEESGMSGARHKVDILLIPKEGGSKIAFLVPGEKDLISEAMLFNSKAEDLDIPVKGVLIDRDISDNERKLLEIYNIKAIDTRKQQPGPGKQTGLIFGVNAIDRKINNSLKKGSVYMISGKTGVGKTTMSLHFLVTGAKKGEKGAIILTDTRPAEFISNSSSFSFGFDEYYKNGMIEVFELSDQIREMKYNILANRKEEKRFINMMITEIRSLVVNDKITRLVIDPITPALIEEDDYINTMINGLAMSDVITIVTSNVRANEFSFFGMEEYYCSGVIKLEFADANYEVRSMSILKMRGSSYDPTPLFYRITGDGIIPVERGPSTPLNREESLLKPLKDLA